MSWYLVFLYIVLLCSISHGSERGKICDDGVCESVMQCPSALQNIQHNIFPKICGFEGPNNEPIVCCPDFQNRIIPSKLPEINSENADDIHFLQNKPKTTAAKRKCHEYAIKACDGALVSPDRRIKEDIHSQKFPHLAVIGYGDISNIFWSCSGSLISEIYILTAARCEYSKFGYAQWARIGVELQEYHSPIYEIHERIIHPDYHYPYAHNDIAIFKLHQKVSFNDRVHPICLQEDSTNPDNLFSVGFGKKNCIDSSCYLQKSNDLQINTVLATKSEIQHHQNCENILHNYAELDITEEKFICAHLTDPHIDECQGTFGDQLLYTIETGCPHFYKLFGILSLIEHSPNEYNCHFLNTTIVFTKISPYLSWIEQIVWKYD